MVEERGAEGWWLEEVGEMLEGGIYWRDLRSCRGSMIYPAFTFSLSFYAGRLDTFLCMEIHRSYEKASKGS